MILLDTDVLSVSLRDQSGPVAQRIRRVHPDACYTSSITIGEILYGLERNPSHSACLRDVVESDALNVLSFDREAARHYARIRVALERVGTPLADPDPRIAAIALAHDLTLITGNDKHFRRVPELKVENWLE